MTQDRTDNEVTVTDGHTSPSTTSEHNDDYRPSTQPEQEPEAQSQPYETGELPNQRSSLRSILRNTITATKTELGKINTRLPYNPELVILGLLTYIGLLITTAVLISPFHTFGLFSMTTGAIILTVIYHPKGNVTPETTIQRYTYPVSGIAFILVGLRYLLTGILFEYPIPI